MRLPATTGSVTAARNHGRANYFQTLSSAFKIATYIARAISVIPEIPGRLTELLCNAVLSHIYCLQQLEEGLNRKDLQTLDEGRAAWKWRGRAAALAALGPKVEATPHFHPWARL